MNPLRAVNRRSGARHLTTPAPAPDDAPPQDQAPAGTPLVHEPLTQPSGRVSGYAVRALAAFGDIEAGTQPADPLDDEYELADLDGLAAGRSLLVQATRRVLAGDDDRVVAHVPAAMTSATRVAGMVTWRRARGLSTGLAGFVGSEPQVALLPMVDVVGVAAHTPTRRLGELVDLAHAAGAQVVAEGVRTQALADQMFTLGVDLVQGRLAPEGELERGGLAASDVTCLELLTLLAEEPVDQNAVIGLVAADPNLTVGVLHLVNSAVFALPRRVESVRQAVVMVGPRLLRALASTSLTRSGRTGLDTLWQMLTRALACWELTGDDVGYTVGLLSAVAEQRRVELPWLAQMAGLSAQTTAALVDLAGPVGAALGAVQAYEYGDGDAAQTYGLGTYQVSRAWLDALPEALAIATALAAPA